MDYSRYIKMQPKELLRELEKQRDSMPLVLRQQIIEQVTQAKKELRSANAKARVINTAWHEIERPLKSELRIIVNMSRYKSKTYHVPERSHAITEYRKVLEKLIKLITKYKQGDYTPNQLAKQKNVPHNGEHWSDWIPQQVKDTITGHFDAIPHHFKAKVKVPFTRRILEEKREVLVKRLLTATKQELERAYKDLATDPDEYDNEDHHEYIRRMKLAQQVIITLPDTAYIPATWQGLFKQKTDEQND